MGKAAERRLWSGPVGSTWVDRVRIEGGLATTWLVPTPIARDRLARRLVRERSSTRRSRDDRVVCWDDLWHDLRADERTGPSFLSASGGRAAMREAIDRAKSADELTVSGEVAGSAGFRRRVSRRIARWMAASRAPEDLPAPVGPVEVEIQAIYRHYQRILGTLGAVDEAGLRAYYAGLFSLTRELPRSWGKVDRLVLIEPPAEERAVRQVIEGLNQSIRQLGVVLTVDGDPLRAEADAAAARFRERLLSWGFLETIISPPEDRPAGLIALDAALFRDGEGRPSLVDRPEGLAIRGASTGEGLARVAATWIRERLAGGESPEDLLILVRSKDEKASVAVETLRAWGLPVSTGEGRPIASDAAVQALRLAMNVPVEDWDTDLLGRLLRNARLRPDWEGVDGRSMALPATAAALRETRVYRGRVPIGEALNRMIEEGGSDPDPSARPDFRRRHRQRLGWLARQGLPVFNRLAALIDETAVDGPWAELVDRLASLAGGLGLDPDEEEALGLLFCALDDHSMVVEGLGKAGDRWTWSRFVDEVEAILRDLPAPKAPTAGQVRFTTVDEAAGTIARHILLTNLSEGTFPDRSAVGPTAEPEDDLGLDDPIGEDSERDEDEEVLFQADPEPFRAGQLRMTFDDAPIAPTGPTPFGREMARFLRVIGQAERSLTLAYPTTDEKGTPQLEAGFLVDVRAALSSEVAEAIVSEDRTLDPALRNTVPLSTPERRIRAMSRAAIGDPTGLAELASIPEHRKVLRASAVALLVNERRSGSRPFHPRRHPIGRLEGMLRDRRIADRLAVDFGPDYAFSASQLESIAFCPFQFFLRYVLRLDPIDERDELDEDRTAGGSMMHAALETLHLGLKSDPPAGGISLDEAITDRIEQAVRDELERESSPASEVGLGLRRIQAERMIRVGKTYADQYRRYAESMGGGLSPGYFEFSFGDEEHRHGPALVLGEGDERVKLQGMIDRIDHVEHPSGTLLRVIDYKTGSVPTKPKLKAGLALQLPLYSMAVERALALESNPRVIDAGYWALRDKGYRPLVEIASYRDGDLFLKGRQEPSPDRIVAFVLDLVNRLRGGMLPVHPADEECERLCDYRTVCRLRQVRKARKPWPEAPSMADPAPEDDR